MVLCFIHITTFATTWPEALSNLFWRTLISHYHLTTFSYTKGWAQLSFLIELRCIIDYRGVKSVLRKLLSSISRSVLNSLVIWSCCFLFRLRLSLILNFGFIYFFHFCIIGLYCFIIFLFFLFRGVRTGLVGLTSLILRSFFSFRLFLNWFWGHITSVLVTSHALIRTQFKAIDLFQLRFNLTFLIATCGAPSEISQTFGVVDITKLTSVRAQILILSSQNSVFRNSHNLLLIKLIQLLLILSNHRIDDIFLLNELLMNIITIQIRIRFTSTSR